LYTHIDNISVYQVFVLANKIRLIDVNVISAKPYMPYYMCACEYDYVWY